jgi:hypothetical protein
MSGRFVYERLLNPSGMGGGRSRRAAETAYF